MKADLRIAVKDYRRSKNGQIPLGSGQLFYHLGKASRRGGRFKLLLILNLTCSRFLIGEQRKMGCEYQGLFSSIYDIGANLRAMHCIELGMIVTRPEPPLTERQCSP
jgi:hypothetical protein